MLWHERMVHADKEIVARMIKGNKYNMSRSGRMEESQCETCVKTKQVQWATAGNLVRKLEEYNHTRRDL